MGRSEWGIALYSNDSIEALRNCIKAHNNSKEGGETLYCVGILKYGNYRFACLVNHGGRDSTSEFIEKWYEDKNNYPLIYYPFVKPEWWVACQNYAWKRKSDEEDIPDIF